MFDINERKQYGKVVLAPMAGITFRAYREFMKPFGVNFAYTEMVSDMGLIYDNDETMSYLAISSDELPIGLQLFGHDPKSMAEAAKIALSKEPRFAFIDINCGCPVLKVTKQGSGSSLLKDPKLIGDIIREIKKVTDIPISIKIRLGWDNTHINFLDVIKEAERAGVSFVAIHARTKSMLYSGQPLYDELIGIKDKVSVPIIYSGDIFTLEDAIKVDELIHPDYIMVARGGLGNPYLITQIDTYFKTGEKLTKPDINTQIDYCLTLAKAVIDQYGEKQGMKIYRSIGPHFFNSFTNAKTLRKELTTKVNTFQDLEKILKEYRKSREDCSIINAG